MRRRFNSNGTFDGSVLLACLLLASAPPAEARMEIAVTDEVKFGKQRYRSNMASVQVAPSRRWSASVRGGIVRFGTPLRGTAGSFGGGVRVEVFDGAALSFEYSRYDGANGFVLDPANLSLSGRLPERQSAEAFSVLLGIVLYAPSRPELPGPTVRLALGGSVGSHETPVGFGYAAPATPVAISSLARWPAGRLLTDESSYSAGITLGVYGTTLGGSYRRYRYVDKYAPVGLAGVPGGFAGAFNGYLFSGPSGIIDGLVRYESALSLSEYMGDGVTGYVSYIHMRMATVGDIARMTRVEVAFVVWTRIEARGGGLWVRRSGRTKRYATLGISVRF